MLGERATEAVALSPATWLLNAGRLIGVSFFWGNSVWSMLGPQPWATVATACAIGLALVWFTLGLSRSETEPGSARTSRDWLARVDLGLLIPALLVGTFPMLIRKDVSELYATPVLMSVALLAGKAFDGRWAHSRPFRHLGAAAGAVGMLIGVWSAWHKVGGIARLGLRTDEQVRQILSHVPASADGWRIAILFNAADTAPG